MRPEYTTIIKTINGKVIINRGDLKETRMHLNYLLENLSVRSVEVVRSEKKN